MAKKKTVTSRPRVTAGKSAAKRSAAKKKPAVAKVKKKAAKKAPAKKAPAKKDVRKTVKKASLKGKTAKKAALEKKPTKVAAKKAPLKSRPAKKPSPEPAPPIRVKKKRRGRITKMTVQETLISLISLEGSWEELEWLHGLILYGPGLRRVAVHREFSFMVVYRGLRSPAQLRQAKVDLDKRIRAAVPVKRHLHFVTDFDILRRVEADDPAFMAVLGHAIAIYVRGSS